MKDDDDQGRAGYDRSHDDNIEAAENSGEGSNNTQSLEKLLPNYSWT